MPAAESDHALHFSSATDDWPTPQAFFDRLDREFGGMGLGVCVDSVNHMADAWYGLSHPDVDCRNALVCDWLADSKGRTVWMNTPYGSALQPFMAKAVDAAQQVRPSCTSSQRAPTPAAGTPALTRRASDAKSAS